MNKKDIQVILTKTPALKEKLYSWGFLFTDADVKTNEYPFYGNWKHEVIGRFNLVVASQQSYYVNSSKNGFIALVGHAYNPFAMISDEQELLEALSIKGFGTKEFFDYLNELTGVFTILCYYSDNLYILGDASGMQNTFYSVADGRVYVSSHTNLVNDFLDLQWSDYAKSLCNYRFFKLLGNAMPGDLTQFEQVKRLVPNHYICIDKNRKITSHRFYTPKDLRLSIDEAAEKASDILSRNLQLIAEKWNRAAISMTGGCDSKTTLSCAKSIYDRFSYFSYTSSESEQVDAEAAHKICEALNLDHKIYTISENDSDYEHIEGIRAILRWNTGDIRDSNRNDVRKRAFFCRVNDFDIEVKSWASEIGRAYYSKRFNGRKNFGDKPSPRKCTTLYKFFFNNRKLVQLTDDVFANYLGTYFEQDKSIPVDWQEQFFWEFRVPSWNGLVITGEHRFSFDIAIPYNNRLLLEILLSVPIEARINDMVYSEIRKRMNPMIDSTGIAVTNLKHTQNRARVENIYYSIHSKLRF